MGGVPRILHISHLSHKKSIPVLFLQFQINFSNKGLNMSVHLAVQLKFQLCTHNELAPTYTTGVSSPNIAKYHARDKSV